MKKSGAERTREGGWGLKTPKKTTTLLCRNTRRRTMLFKFFVRQNETDFRLQPIRYTRSAVVRLVTLLTTAAKQPSCVALRASFASNVALPAGTPGNALFGI